MIPMGEPDDRDDAPAGPSDAPPTVKARNAVQQEVSRLLDAVAPERAAHRTGTKTNEVERHRTPRGCVLQAAAGAVTVSWFADSAQGAELGELQVVRDRLAPRLVAAHVGCGTGGGNGAATRRDSCR
jgi:hypothetical protein